MYVKLSAFFLLLVSVYGSPELKLLQILFMHKSYAPIRDIKQNVEEYSGLPRDLNYEYFKNITTEMPQVGKLNMYQLGVHLREEYGQFLGDDYTTAFMRMRTTNHVLSKMAAQLVNAGLWPPSENQTWNKNLSWQPIPFEYEDIDKDMLLLGTMCPHFILEMKEVIQSFDAQKSIIHYEPFFQYISKYTNMSVTHPSDIEFLYNTLETIVGYNLSFPTWAEETFPNGQMHDLMLLQYDLLSKTNLQKQLNGGTFLKEIIFNSLSYAQGYIPAKRKLLMYSGDYRNIVGVLKNMGVWIPHIPAEASALIFELYFENSTKTYSMKINYYTGVYNETIELTLEACSVFCPLDIFVWTLVDFIPTNEEELCGWKDFDFYDAEENLGKMNDACSTHTSRKMMLMLILTSIFYSF